MIHKHAEKIPIQRREERREGGKKGGREGRRGKVGQKFTKPTSAKHTNLKLKNNIIEKWVLKGQNALKSQKQS